MTAGTAPRALLADAFPDRPGLDMALSHALLRRVAEGARPATVRLYEPGPTVAFSRLDAHSPGFAAACDAARAHGYEPVIRLGGGHAAAYGPGCLIHEEILPHGSPLEGLQARYAQEEAHVLSALRRAGVEGVAVGQLDGEYCAGAHSLHLGGVKIAGIAQRVVKGAALISTALLVEAGPSLRAVLVDVYGALAIDWRPETAGSLADVIRAPSLSALATALSPEPPASARRAPARAHGAGATAQPEGAGADPGALDPAELILAESLASEHRP